MWKGRGARGGGVSRVLGGGGSGREKRVGGLLSLWEHATPLHEQPTACILEPVDLHYSMSKLRHCLQQICQSSTET